MKKVMLFAFILMLFGTLAQAQSTQNFVISASASGYGGVKGTQMVQLSGVAFQVTKNISAGYLQISNPTDGTQPKYRLGVLNYTRELKAYLGSKLVRQFVFDTSNWLVTIQAGAGKVNYEGVNRIAETAGAFLSRPLANHLQWQVVGYQYLHGQGTSFLTRNNAQDISSGLTFTF